MNNSEILIYQNPDGNIKIDVQLEDETVFPDNLKKLFTEYSKERTESILNQTKEVQLWIKQQ